MTVCGDGGRVTVGKCTNDERAADDDDVDIVEKVRCRSCGICDSLRMVAWTGAVAIEWVEEKDVRRSCKYDGVSGPGDVGIVLVLAGEVDSLPFKALDRESASCRVSEITVSGVRGLGLHG